MYENNSRLSSLIYGVFDYDPERQILALNGKVGIGSIIPTYQLDVKGEINSRSANGFRIRGTSRSTILRSDDSDFYIMATETGDPDGAWNTLRPFIFNLTNGTTWLGGQALTVIHGGNVGIGTTTPNYKLDVRGSIGNNTTLYHSDLRWKKDIRPIQYGLVDLMKLNGVSYLWNVSAFPEMGFDKEIQFGFIAQEFEKIIPELVKTDKDGYKSIDYVKLTPLLVKAIHEQQIQIENQQKQIDDLKTLVNNLTGNIHPESK